MGETLASDNLQIRLAEKAADQLFDTWNDDVALPYEPIDLPAAEAAVRRLGERIKKLPKAITGALDAARDSGDLLSSDKLQGMSEIIQNADDVNASQIRLVLGSNNLWVGHDGSPVQLPHVLGLATPWLTTKSSEAAPIGRFGIGLMTLRSISNTLEVHCHPYHIRLGDPPLSPIDPSVLPPNLREADWTILRIPFEQDKISSGELAEWLDRWGSSALLFLRRVSRVTLLDTGDNMIRELSISRSDVGEVPPNERNPNRKISRQAVEASDGQTWLVYTEEVTSPVEIRRTRKATDTTTSISIALPQCPVDHGQIYAGLPVIQTRLPIFTNAQFDPITNRRDFADNKWNRELIPLVADLWSRAALDLFARNPKVAWQAIPLPDAVEDNDQSPFIAELENAIVNQARQRIASQLSLPVPEQGKVRLTELAVEAQPLEQILTVTETAALAGLPATLPVELRDQNSRWRTVLDDWRSAGAGIPDEVSVEKALNLVGDETRRVSSTIALVAAGLKEGFEERLMKLPCIVAQDGRHMVPPSADSPTAVTAKATPLAEQLGVVTLLHAEHLSGGKAAVAVLKWLRSCEALLDISDNRDIIRRLATAGKAGRRIETPLTDQQVQALREVFEGMDLEYLRDLGPGIGQAVALEAYRYEVKGNKRQRIIDIARPADAYLPRAINRKSDSFPIAAHKSAGVMWISDRYAKILRSSSGREGIGAQRFLRHLGAEAAPRLRLHPKLKQRYSSESRLGLHISIPNSPHIRNQAMQDREATYTLQDRDCPTLEAVIQDISQTRPQKTRRKRAVALLATLSQAWGRLYSEFSEVESALDYSCWQDKGRMSAYWLCVAGDVAWLDDENGTPRRPSELRLRTPGNVAIHGQDSPDYLHPDLDQPDWRSVLAALGVSGDSSQAELVTRLKELRDSAEDKERWSPEEIKRGTAVFYKALAQSLTQVGRSGHDIERLRRDFEHHNGLIFTNLGWLPPQGVLAGPPIFGKHRAFAPQIADTDPLWAALKLREPSFEDCIGVIRAVARKHRTPEPDEEAILLETLRMLASRAKTSLTTQARKKLRQLPLWTSKGWMRDRPVYATHDHVLIVGLRDQLPLWDPGGDLQQFYSLLHLLRVEEINADAAQVIEPDQATEDGESSDRFRSALQLLQEDLSRNDPQLAKDIRMPWNLLREFEVYVHPSLTVGVNVGPGDSTWYKCEVEAKVDIDRRMVFVRRPEELSRVDTGGWAIATLFEGDPRRLAQAWRAACDRAESGRQARPLKLAEEQSKHEQQQTESEIKLWKLDTDIQQRQDRSRNSVNRGSGLSETADTRRKNQETPPTLESTRVLVNPETLDIVDPKGRLESSEQNTPHKTSGDRNLVEPKIGGNGPRSRSLTRLYTPLQKETVGLELLRKLLSSDVEKIVDIRAQHGVGADAIDKLNRFYELKVSAGAEPDHVTMTSAEVERARTTSGFFLVVISGIEGVDAQPRVRIIADPLNQLQQTTSGSITLSGVRNATSLTYKFTHKDGAGQADEENETEISEENLVQEG